MAVVVKGEVVAVTVAVAVAVAVAVVVKGGVVVVAVAAVQEVVLTWHIAKNHVNFYYHHQTLVPKSI